MGVVVVRDLMKPAPELGECCSFAPLLGVFRPGPRPASDGWSPGTAGAEGRRAPEVVPRDGLVRLGGPSVAWGSHMSWCGGDALAGVAPYGDEEMA